MATTCSQHADDLAPKLIATCATVTAWYRAALAGDPVTQASEPIVAALLSANWGKGITIVRAMPAFTQDPQGYTKYLTKIAPDPVEFLAVAAWADCDGGGGFPGGVGLRHTIYAAAVQVGTTWECVADLLRPWTLLAAQIADSHHSANHIGAEATANALRAMRLVEKR